MQYEFAILTLSASAQTTICGSLECVTYNHGILKVLLLTTKLIL